MTNDRAPIDQAINCVLFILDIAASMTLDRQNYDEIAAEEENLKEIIFRAQMILDLIEEHRPPKLRAVQ